MRTVVPQQVVSPAALESGGPDVFTPVKEESRLNLEYALLTHLQTFNQCAVLTAESHRVHYTHLETKAFGRCNDLLAVLERQS
ncbi:hypothetical protein D9M69_728710 [compost metagenome]